MHGYAFKWLKAIILLAEMNPVVAACIDNLYNPTMIKSFRHKGLEAFYRKGSRAGINPRHSTRLHAQLSALDVAKSADDMAFPGWRLHPLGHDLAGYWAVSVNGNWRMIFRFDGEDAELVDYLDYH